MFPEVAAQFGINVPSGFGYDFAGVVDEVGDGVEGLAVGDRVYGGAMGGAVADFLVMNTPPEAPQALFHTPDGISDVVASTLPVAGMTAAAALAAIDLRSGDMVLVGGAADGVGVFVVQLAKLAGATVIGTASEGTFEFLRQLGAEPVAYGSGLGDRVLALAPAGVRATWGGDAQPDALARITDAIRAGKITVPIAATFPIEQIRDAVTLQAGRHVHGKIVITL